MFWGTPIARAAQVYICDVIACSGGRSGLSTLARLHPFHGTREGGAPGDESGFLWRRSRRRVRRGQTHFKKTVGPLRLPRETLAVPPRPLPPLPLHDSESHFGMPRLSGNSPPPPAPPSFSLTLSLALRKKTASYFWTAAGKRLSRL